ncbi:MAG: hypothetical protein OER21_10985 [Gemmatimonadota bacterium]|nr:hypothetical protein [Gemmatimonadota bacterium]
MTLRVADLDDDTPTLQDAAATWLLGHTDRITFGTPYVEHRQVLVRAVVHVPCKYLRDGRADGRKDGKTAGPEVRCEAHGFRGRLPPPARRERATLRQDDERFTVVHRQRVREMALPLKHAGRRALPVIHHGSNPCAAAPCRTADNTQGAACCRDLTIDVVALDGASDELEALLRARKSPYLCKVARSNPTTLECEIISACGYLDTDGVHCVLHGRVRPDGRPAKPSICSEWPEPDEEDFTGHPGCVFL